MDKRKLLLLKFLLNTCKDGYKVLETNKVLQAVKKYKGDYNLLVEDIGYLKSRKYLDLKYIDENNLCLSVLDNSRILQENIKMDSATKREYLNVTILTMILSGIMSFLGAFLAILLFK